MVSTRSFGVFSFLIISTDVSLDLEPTKLIFRLCLKFVHWKLCPFLLIGIVFILKLCITIDIQEGGNDFSIEGSLFIY